MDSRSYYSTPAEDKSDLEKLAEFILEVGRKHIYWNANIEGTFVTKLLLQLVRKKVPSDIKKMILESDIKPDKYSEQDEINSLLFTINDKETNSKDLVDFETIYNTYLYPDLLKGKKRSSTHKDGTRLSSRQESERYAYKASQVGVGNCNECSDTSVAIWLESDNKICNTFFSSGFAKDETPFLEQVEYKNEEDHCFNIINRPQNSSLNNIYSWVEKGDEVIIVDLWGEPNQPINVNAELASSPIYRNKPFALLLDKLEAGAQLISTATYSLGEGHSSRWRNKNKDNYFFIKKAFPDHPFFKDKKRSADEQLNERDTKRFKY